VFGVEQIVTIGIIRAIPVNGTEDTYRIMAHHVLLEFWWASSFSEREFAAKEKLEIVASLCEAQTAKEPGRTKFAEID
jgi:hypothetical protein